MPADSDPLEHLSDEELESLERNIAFAKGNLHSALELLDGKGGEVRERLATAYGPTESAQTAIEGIQALRNRGEWE